MDELIQLAHNADPLDGAEQDCEQFYYALQNANFNVLGLIAETGEVVERYEYTPYGQRTVYTTAGSADPAAHTPTLMSQRVELAGVAQPYALNPMGHQGLMHDEASNLIYNRARMLHPRLGRFLQRDPLTYIDGMSTYGAYASMHGMLDPHGLSICCNKGDCKIAILSMNITDLEVKANGTFDLLSPNSAANTLAKILKKPNPATPIAISILAASAQITTEIHFEADVDVRYAIKYCETCEPSCPTDYRWDTGPDPTGHKSLGDVSSGRLLQRGQGYDMTDPVQLRELARQIVVEYRGWYSNSLRGLIRQRIASQKGCNLVNP